MLNCS